MPRRVEARRATLSVSSLRRGVGSDPDLDPSPLGILGRVQRISARLVSATEDLLEPVQIGWEAFSLIVSLRRAGKPYAMRPTDIYRQSLITSGAVTNRIDRVSKLGLVRRVPDPNDRRGIIVELTPAGKRLPIAHRFAVRHAGRAAFGAVAVRAAQLSTLLAKLLFSLEATEAISAKSPEGSKWRQRETLSYSAS